MSEDNLTPPPPPPVSGDEQRAIDAVKAAEAPKPAQKKATAKKKVATKSTMGKFKSKVIPMYHPYQKVTVPVAHSVPLEVDSWVQVQVNAGVLIRTE